MSEKELMSTDAFLVLSAEINYQLSAKKVNHHALLSLLLGGAKPPGDPEVLVEVIDLIQFGYQKRRRKLGPAAVIHPLRTAALLSRTMSEPSMLGFLGALLHDKDEDISPEEIGQTKWNSFDARYRALVRHIDPEQRWYLGERIPLLTRVDNQSYNAYLGSIIDHAKRMPDLLHVKMADRLDNTFDVSVARPGVTRYNFFRNVFDAMFVPVYQGVDIEEYHFLPAPKEGVQLLSNLFKNTIFLSMLRLHRLCGMDYVTRRLTDALAVASMRVAQWVALEVFASFITDVGHQRALLMEAMTYCMDSDAILSITEAQRGGLLDGIFLGHYPTEDSAGRKQQLGKLYEDPEQLLRTAVVFIAIFSCFLNDPEYYIKGIDRTGVWAVE